MKYQFTKIAVKIGSNVLTRKDGTLDVTRISALLDQIAELYKAGVEVILVSSGAVASGRSEIRPSKKLDSVDQRQLFSAVGQAKLINRYYELFRDHGIAVGQVLTMKENFSTRRHYLNQRNCMMVMRDNSSARIKSLPKRHKFHARLFITSTLRGSSLSMASYAGIILVGGCMVCS